MISTYLLNLLAEYEPSITWYKTIFLDKCRNANFSYGTLDNQLFITANIYNTFAQSIVISDCFYLSDPKCSEKIIEYVKKCLSYLAYRISTSNQSTRRL